MPALNVLILTQQDCTSCETAKTLLARLAREYPLSVSTLAIDSREGQALAQKGGILFPPGIFIDGAALSYGRPSEGRIRREIESRLAK
jgi:thiol-disulfide isomerase/thioredoxin